MSEKPGISQPPFWRGLWQHASQRPWQGLLSVWLFSQFSSWISSLASRPASWPPLSVRVFSSRVFSWRISSPPASPSLQFSSPLLPAFTEVARRLTQIRGRVKKPLMFGQGEAVGHSGDEVADPPCTIGFAVCPVRRPPFGRQIVGYLLVAREQVEQDLFGIAHHPHHPRMAVHP